MVTRSVQRIISRRVFLRSTARLSGAGLLGLLGASGTTPASPSATVPPAPATSPPAVATSPATAASVSAQISADFPGAQSASVATVPAQAIYVVFGKGHDLFVVRSTDGGRTFDAPCHANPGAPALVMAVERPTLTVDADGHVSITWIEIADHTRHVRYARSQDAARSFGASTLVATGSQHDTIMVRMAVDEAGHPVIAWLDHGTLRMARSFDRGMSFPVNQTVDEQVCDCCQPHPLAHDGRVLIAYRNLERDTQGGDIRDAYVAISDDDGRSFGAPARASDAHWQLNACPTSGPSIASVADRLYVSWMDGRNDPGVVVDRSDIWLASSDDRKQFSANTRINPAEGGYNDLPVLAAGADGRLHIAWEAREARRHVLYYASSGDGGATFSTPLVVASSDDGQRRGTPTAASVAVSQPGRVHLAWVDTLGARFATLET